MLLLPPDQVHFPKGLPVVVLVYSIVVYLENVRNTFLVLYQGQVLLSRQLDVVVFETEIESI